MPLINKETGDELSDTEAQERIRQTIARTGRFILFDDVSAPRIGQVEMYAGLPLRVVKFVTFEEAKANACEDIWGGEPKMFDPNACYFEVEVAD